jgi:hypothetical protein
VTIGSLGKSGAGDRLPVGCAVLVIIALSLLLWAILLILLLRLFDAVADYRGNMKRRAVIPSCRSAIHNGCGCLPRS